MVVRREARPGPDLVAGAMTIERLVRAAVSAVPALWIGTADLALGETPAANPETPVAAVAAPISAPSIDREVLHWNFEFVDQRDAMRRITSGLRLDLPLMNFVVRAHDITATPWANSARSGLTEALLGSDYDFGPAFRLSLAGGFYSAGTGEFVGEVLGRFVTKVNARFDVGLYRRPLALLVPLEREDLGVMRNAVWLEFSLGDYMDARYEYRREEDLAPHDDARVTFRVPLLRKKDGSHEGDFRILGSSAFHSRPSPFYVSPLRVTTAAAGYEWRGLTWGVKHTGRFAGDYGVAFVTDRDRGDARQVGFLRLDGSAEHVFAEHLRVRGRASLMSAREDVNEEIVGRLLKIAAEVQWDI